MSPNPELDAAACLAMIQADSSTVTTHPTTQQLIDFIAGRTSTENEWTVVEDHLEKCTACQEIALRVPLSHLEARLAISTQANYAQAGHSQDDADTEPHQASWKLNQAYEIAEEIGRGAYGIVYRAIHPGLKRQVALKMLLAGAKAHPRQLTRFRREAYSLAKLRHPNIVTIFDSGDQDGVPYLAMEFISGGSLADQLQTGPLEVNLAAALVRQLALAVSHAHQLGILHRDLKPHNILLDKHECQSSAAESGRVATSTFHVRSPNALELPWCPKIVDFGLARFEEAGDGMSTCTGEFLGTPEYMPPEMMHVRAEAMTPAVDIYGLGAILYECLSGRPPFQGSSLTEVTQQVALLDPPAIRYLRPNVPRDLETICLRCLSKDPHQRFASAADLANDLERFLNGKTIHSRRPGWLQLGWRWCHRNPWRAIAVLSVAGLCSSIPAVGIYYGKRLSQQARVASANYEATRASLWQVLDHVQKSAGGEIPKLTQLSLAQAQDARELFKRLKEQDPTPRATLDLIKADLLVGSLAVMLGKKEEGGSDFHAARDLCEELQRVPGFRDDALSLQASALNKLATTTMGQNPSQALEYQSAAMAIHERLAANSPDPLQSRSDLAWSQHTLGSIYLLMKDIPHAIEHFQRSVGIRKELEDQQGKSHALSHAIAGSLVNLALTRSNANQLDEAESNYKEAIARFDEIRRSDNTEIANPQLLGDWSSALLNYATMIANNNRADESLMLCSQAIEVLAPAVAREPNVALLSGNLFKHYATRAQLHLFHGKFLEAADDWNQCIKYSDDPTWIRHCQIQSLVAQSQSSEYKQALEALDQLLQELEETKKAADVTLGQWQFMVLIPPLAFEAAQGDASHAVSDRSGLAEECIRLTKRIVQLSAHAFSALQSEADLQASHWTCLKSMCTEAQWHALID